MTARVTERPEAVSKAITNLSFFKTKAAKKAASVQDAAIRILPEEVEAVGIVLDYIAKLEEQTTTSKEDLKVVQVCGFVIGEDGEEYRVNVVAEKIGEETPSSMETPDVTPEQEEVSEDRDKNGLPDEDGIPKGIGIPEIPVTE